MADPTTLYLPINTRFIDANGTLTPDGWQYLKNLQVSLTTIDLTSQVTGILPVVNGGTGNATGKAPSAVVLNPGANINGTLFTGASNIVVSAAAGTLTGTTLAATVVTSSLTSVGTLTALVVSGTVTGFTDIYTTNWTDYSATSTITGWASFTTKAIFYKAIGKSIFVQFNLTGTSNATTASFTLPAAMATSVKMDILLGSAADNSVTLTNPALAEITTASASTVSMYTNQSGTGWTNSGTKSTVGQFWYEAA